LALVSKPQSVYNADLMCLFMSVEHDSGLLFSRLTLTMRVRVTPLFLPWLKRSRCLPNAK
jgi:hypothetical protein